MNEKITLQDIAGVLAEKHDMPRKEAELFVKTLLDVVEEALAVEKYVKIKGLGTFKLTEVESRESVNVNTGERFEIQGHTKVAFTPDATMKELINKPFSHFETVILNDETVLEDTETVSPVVDEKAENEPMAEPMMETETVVVEESVEETAEEPVVVEQPEEIIQPEEEAVPEVKEEKQEVPLPPMPEEEKKDSKLLTGIIVTLVILILLGFYWLFLRSEESQEPMSVVSSVQTETVVEEPADTLVVPKDTVAVQPEPVKTVEAKPTTSTKVAVLSDTLEYEIVGTQATHVLKDGETLIKLSVRFFGSKNFWPYIVKHNKDVVKDADRVPIGTSLRIPELKAKK